MHVQANTHSCRGGTEDDMAALAVPHAVLDYVGLLNHPLEAGR